MAMMVTSAVSHPEVIGGEVMGGEAIGVKAGLAGGRVYKRDLRQRRPALRGEG